MRCIAVLRPAVKTVCAVFIAIALLLPANAQDAAISSRNVPMNIQPGQGPATVNGLVAGNTRLVHSVRIASGQRLTVQLRSGNPDLVFGIYARSGAPVFEGRRGQGQFSAVLRRSGTYAVIVSFRREARRKNAIYQLSVSVTDGDGGVRPTPQPPVDPVTDLVRVVGINANDTLAVRDGPGTQFEVIGELSPGTRRLRLGTCRQSNSGNWCNISTTRSVPVSGWVNARFLTEDNS